MDNKEKEVVFLRNRYRKRCRSEDCCAMLAAQAFFTAKGGREEGFWLLAIGHWLECLRVQLVLLPQRKEDAEIAQRLRIKNTTYRPSRLR